MHVTSVLFLVRFNHFAPTTCFYWSYTLLFKSSVVMCSWYNLIEQQVSLTSFQVMWLTSRIQMSPAIFAWIAISPITTMTFCWISAMSELGSTRQAAECSPRGQGQGCSRGLGLNGPSHRYKCRCGRGKVNVLDSSLDLVNYVKWPSGLAVQCIYITGQSYVLHKSSHLFIRTLLVNVF